MILSSYKQYEKYLNLLEDQKRYPQQKEIKGRKAGVSFSGIEIASPDGGSIPMFVSRFVPADEMFFLNSNHLELHLRPGGFEWFDEDGRVFLRNSTLDQYDARYGGYGQTFFNPHFQGYLHSLAV
jgi:hypothetical protein